MIDVLVAAAFAFIASVALVLHLHLWWIVRGDVNALRNLGANGIAMESGRMLEVHDGLASARMACLALAGIAGAFNALGIDLVPHVNEVAVLLFLVPILSIWESAIVHRSVAKQLRMVQNRPR